MERGERSARVSVQARRFRCEGDIGVPTARGYRDRVIDLLNDVSDFLALADVLLYRASEGAASEDPVHYDVFLLRKGEIEFVVPLD